MNQYLQTIQDLLQKNGQLTEQDKQALLKAVIDADRQWNITDFKLDRTEKVKRTTATLLEETIAELENKRKAIEEQNHELEIEASLERVRSVAMGMKRREDMLEVCKTISHQLESLNVKEIRNVQTGIFYESKGSYTNYEFYAKHDKVFITDVEYKNHPVSDKFASQMLKGHNEVFVHGFTGGEVKDWLDYQKTTNVFIDSYLETAESLTYYWYSLGPVAMGISTYIPLSEDEINLFKRFRNVFELAYRRYLDIEKAEAQAREARIEAALEKIRSRSLAMHHADELKDVISVLREKLKELGIAMQSRTVLILTLRKNSKNFTQWVARPEDPSGKSETSCFETPNFDHPILIDFWRTKENGLNFFSRVYTPAEKLSFFKYLFENTDGRKISEEEKSWVLKPTDYAISAAIENNSAIIISNFSNNLLSDDEVEILKRFARVFEQAYIRFLDLQKVEAQAREAQIEAAIEKVRSRSLAMHKSDELQDVVNTVFERLRELGVDFYTAIIILFHDDSKDIVWWLQNRESQQYPRILVPYRDVPYLYDLFEARQEKKEFFTKSYSFQEKNKLFDHLFTRTDFKYTPEKQKDFLLKADLATMCVGLARNTAIHLTSYTRAAFSDEECSIIKRFATVFDQAYTRFLDLQKAEAQAKEARIETALEKVRSRSLAMHHSDELEQVVASLFDRLVELGLSFDGALIFIFEKENKNIQLWIATKHLTAPVKIDLPYDEEIKNNAIINDFWNAIVKGEHIFNRAYSGQTKNDYFRYIQKYNKSKIPESIRTFQIEQDTWTACFAAEKNSIIGFDSWSGPTTTPEDFQILIRFSRVFEQAYTRFLDLQKAEERAKEARVEAALERVRSRAMGMNNTQDLTDTIGVFYKELQSFSLTPRRCGVGLLDKERSGELFTWNTTEQGQSFELAGTIRLEGHPVLDGVYEHWLNQQEYHPVLRGNQIREYYEIVRPQIAFPNYSKDDVLYGYFFFFSQGGVYAYTDKEMHEDELQIYRRFTSVLSLTYKRYTDLAQAEAHAKEAIKQSALDRIRADIASMRTIGDLDRITPLIWNELTILGIPFIRCGVFLMDDTQELIHTFLSTPEGQAIAAFHLPYNTPGNIEQILTNWRRNRNYIDHWDEITFTEFANSLVKQGALTSAEQYMKTLPPGGFFLHFLPFMQGMLYVGNTNRLDDDQVKLLQSVADAFSTAYARYEDFNNLEAAKEQVDKTLEDLRQAQTQLVQSEKMASLGELTAGIAHEIQNPLNFVNNFSDVSNELLDEMKTELEQGNKKDAIALVEDVKQNLEKILHHGRRADAIVKGMLQHSRISSGQKELTDVNMLADEYLRLAYHGLRAKDKSFNAKFESNFDNSLDRINIIPQDIGRVILNLINNAFYTVNEKRKQNNVTGYEPTVRVATKRDNGKVEIKVKDNGNGIPQKILDKIFQPFFTTKPTGQGTGLGLSLSYDIIRAHGGEITVDTREGEGSEFVITIPSM